MTHVTDFAANPWNYNISVRFYFCHMYRMFFFIVDSETKMLLSLKHLHQVVKIHLAAIFFSFYKITASVRFVQSDQNMPQKPKFYERNILKYSINNVPTVLTVGQIYYHNVVYI